MTEFSAAPQANDPAERLAMMDIDRVAEYLTTSTGVYVEPFEMPADPANRERCELALAHTATAYDVSAFLENAKQTRGSLWAVRDAAGSLTVYEFNGEVSEAWRNSVLSRLPVSPISPTIH